MSIEENIKNCEMYLQKIKQYDPEPYYVNYFFNEYIISIKNTLRAILEEANRDFGLFISENISKEIFLQKAKMKNDTKAIEFLDWYITRSKKEHENTYPNFILKICEFQNKFKKLPEIKIKIRALDRYENDINQEIKVNLSHEKLRSKDELDIEIKRQLPIFLEIINHKRRKKHEPKVEKNQVVASTFLDIDNQNDVELVYASEIYIPVLKRLVAESRKKIKELTNYSN
jgi:hypothetical protein